MRALQVTIRVIKWSETRKDIKAPCFGRTKPDPGFESVVHIARAAPKAALLLVPTSEPNRSNSLLPYSDQLSPDAHITLRTTWQRCR